MVWDKGLLVWKKEGSVFFFLFFFFPEERYVSGETVERCAPISSTHCCRKSGIFETTERILGRTQHPGYSSCVNNQQVFKQRCRFACWLAFAEFHYRFLELGCPEEAFLYHLILSESIPDLSLPRKAECSCFSWHRNMTPAYSYCCLRKQIPETKEEFLCHQISWGIWLCVSESLGNLQVPIFIFCTYPFPCPR